MNKERNIELAKKWRKAKYGQRQEETKIMFEIKMSHLDLRREIALQRVLANANTIWRVR